MIVKKYGGVYIKVLDNVYTQNALAKVSQPPENFELYIGIGCTYIVVKTAWFPVRFRVGSFIFTDQGDFWEKVERFANGIAEWVAKEYGDNIKEVYFALDVKSMVIEKEDGKRIEMEWGEEV